MVPLEVRHCADMADVAQEHLRLAAALIRWVAYGGVAVEVAAERDGLGGKFGEVGVNVPENDRVAGRGEEAAVEVGELDLVDLRAVLVQTAYYRVPGLAQVEQLDEGVVAAGRQQPLIVPAPVDRVYV